jgi:hypothetical protein
MPTAAKTPTTPKPRLRSTARTGNPTADAARRDAALAAENSVITGVTVLTAPEGTAAELDKHAATPKPTPARARKPRATATAPPTPKPTPKPTSARGRKPKATEPIGINLTGEPDDGSKSGKLRVQAAKQDLARRAVSAVGAMVARLSAAELKALDMTREEAARCASQWIHHLPAGNREDGKRWWAESLPRPIRSDWK